MKDNQQKILFLIHSVGGTIERDISDSHVHNSGIPAWCHVGESQPQHIGVRVVEKAAQRLRYVHGPQGSPCGHHESLNRYVRPTRDDKMYFVEIILNSSDIPKFISYLHKQDTSGMSAAVTEYAFT